MSPTSTVKKIILASMLALSLGACAVMEGQETSGQYVDDATVTASVKKAFIADEKIKSFQIHVETMDGAVQLSGFVDNPENKKRAVELAKHVRGVTSVQDGMVISPPDKG